MVQLAVKDGKEYSSVRLYLDPDGTIRMEGHDMGPNVEKFFDHDDYEYDTIVPSSAVGRLAFALLKDRFRENLNAVHELREFCKENRIHYDVWSWP